MSAAHWRAQSFKAIEAAIKRKGTDDLKALYYEISRSYPFGVRNQYPYKIWIECVRSVMADLKAKSVPIEAQLPRSTETQPSLFEPIP